MQAIRNDRLSQTPRSEKIHPEAVTTDRTLRPFFMHGVHATGSPKMNQDLINGTRHLAKNNIRHLHVEPGRRVEVVSCATSSCKPAKRSTSTAPAMRSSARSPTHATWCSTPSRLTEPGP